MRGIIKKVQTHDRANNAQAHNLLFLQSCIDYCDCSSSVWGMYFQTSHTCRSWVYLPIMSPARTLIPQSMNLPLLIYSSKSRHPIQWNHSQWLDHSDGVPKYRVLFVRMESEGKSRWNWVTSHSCFMILVFERSSYRALRRWSLVGERRGESSVFTQWRREMLNSEYFACDMNTYRRIRRFSSEYA